MHLFAKNVKSKCKEFYVMGSRSFAIFTFWNSFYFISQEVATAVLGSYPKQKTEIAFRDGIWVLLSFQEISDSFFIWYSPGEIVVAINLSKIHHDLKKKKYQWIFLPNNTQGTTISLLFLENLIRWTCFINKRASN